MAKKMNNHNVHGYSNDCTRLWILAAFWKYLIIASAIVVAICYGCSSLRLDNTINFCDFLEIGCILQLTRHNTDVNLPPDDTSQTPLTKPPKHLFRHQGYAALVISISSNLSFGSVRSFFSQVILIGSISVEVSVTPKVGVAAVASPTGMLELDTHSSSKTNPSKSSLPPVYVALMVLPFLCSDDSEVASRSSSPTTSTLEILTAPIPPAPSAIVSPSTDIISPIDAPPEIHRRRAILIRPEEDIPIGRLYRTHPGRPCRALTVRKPVRPLPSNRLALRYTSCHLDSFTFGSSSGHSSSDHSSSGYSISGHSLSGHTSPDTTIARALRYSEAIAVGVPSYAKILPPRKRFRDFISSEDSVEEDIDTDVLADIEADATAVKVAADMDVEAEVDASIGMEVDVGVDVEDEVEDEVESSDRGTMEVRVDLIAEIDI
nr:hypothetical protein [Tanacetum cinerariifolium]